MMPQCASELTRSILKATVVTPEHRPMKPGHSAMIAPSPRSILAWMCVLIAVNQLGFGAVIPPWFGGKSRAVTLAVGACVDCGPMGGR